VKQISFDKERRAAAIDRIQRHFADELDQTLGAFAAERLLEFFAEEVGGFYYNQGLADAQTVFGRAVDSVNDTIYSLEQREARAR
jgi:uncharacterized protein (DUF2164 family)